MYVNENTSMESSQNYLLLRSREVGKTAQQYQENIKTQICFSNSHFDIDKTKLKRYA